MSCSQGMPKRAVVRATHAVPFLAVKVYLNEQWYAPHGVFSSSQGTLE